MRQVSISHWGPVTLTWDEYDALWRAATESGNWLGYTDFDPEWDKSLPSSKFKNDLAFTGDPKFLDWSVSPPRELRIVEIDPETVVHCGKAERVTINLSHTFKTAEDFARAMNADA